MNEEDARKQIDQYLHHPEIADGHRPPSDWLGDEPLLCKLPNGNWLVTRNDDPYQGLLLKADGTSIPFSGALGQLVRKHGFGMPESREYFLASSSRGRYQMYEHGLAVWEAFDMGGDLGYPIARWDSLADRSRKVRALIAFFDLRGFTNWSKTQEANIIQQIIEALEISFQNAFARTWCKKLFAKGTGDGFMVVSEISWYEPNLAQGSGSTFQTGHVSDFCRACAHTIVNCVPQLRDNLAIGCGITIGDITQLYLLGRYDYIGSAVNDASKMQAKAKNHICLTADVKEHLEAEGLPVTGDELSATEILISPEILIQKHSH